MIYGNLEKAFDTILKLREVYDNGSFQSYTAKALMLICIAEQRTDLALKFLESYRNSDIASISLNSLLLLKYQFNDSLTAPEIIRNHKYFGFQNDRYIKKQPELFNKIFLELLQRNFHADQIDLNIHFPTNISALPTKQEKIFANTSLRDYEAPMPSFQNSELMKKVLSLLEKCHETVKNQLRYGTNSNLGKIKGGKDRFDKDTFTSVDGHEFEIYCAHLLSSDGFVSIELTRNSGDQGVDILAVKDSIKYGIQCKLYSKHVGNSAVQEIHSGITFYNCQKGIVLTNNYFTASATELADKLGIILWDRDHYLLLQQNISN